MTPFLTILNYRRGSCVYMKYNWRGQSILKSLSGSKNSNQIKKVWNSKRIYNDIVHLNYLFYSVAVNYYLEGGRQSWNQICERHDIDCTENNYGFTDTSTLTIFRDNGVNYTTGLDTDTYSHTDDPKYIKRCVGFNEEIRWVEKHSEQDQLWQCTGVPK